MTLEQKEKWAYWGTILLEGFLILLCLAINLKEVTGAAGGSPPPSSSGKVSPPDAKKEDIKVELVNIEEILKNKGGEGSLVSEQKGKGIAAEDQKSSASSKTQVSKPVEKGTTASNPNPSAKAEDSKAPMEKALSKGDIPPIKYVGDQAVLLEEYPRIEVAWIHVENPVPGQELPPVAWQIVMNKEGLIGAENCSTKAKFGEFSSITMRYRSDERILAVSKTAMGLWKQKTSLNTLTGIPLEDTKATWGYYRHRGEVALLDTVSSLFRTAVGMGVLPADACGNGYLEVNVQKQAGQIVISSVYFVPTNSGFSKKKL